MNEIINLLEKAEYLLKTADHMIYITYPLIKESRLLKKILEQLYDIANKIVKAVLRYESLYKRIQLYGNENDWEIFKSKCSARFDFSIDDIKNLEQLFNLMKKHQSSSVEFIRREKLVIMSDNLRTESIGLENLKEYLISLKNILQKAKSKINTPIYKR